MRLPRPHNPAPAILCLILGTIAALIAVNLGFALRATPGNVGLFQVLYALVLYDPVRQPSLAIAAHRAVLPIGERPIVFDKAFKRFPCEIEPIEGRIASLKGRHDA